jgi:hypothetical protein
VPVLSIDAKGRVTALSSTPISGSAGGTVTSITAGTGLDGGTIIDSGTIAIATLTTAQSNVGSETQIPVLSINAQGQVTALSSVTASGGGAPLATTAPAALATTAIIGLSTAAARADHQHIFPTAAQVGALATTQLGAANGVCPLGADSRVASAYLPVSSAFYTVSADRTTSSTLALTDAQTISPVNSATGVNLTIPTNASVAIPVGSIVNVIQKGAGRINYQASNGVTILSPSSQVSSAGQNFNNILSKIATDTWHVDGSLLGTDPNYSQISTLLHFNGTNGSQVFTDNGPSALTFTANNANSTLTTASFQFGTASLSVIGSTGNYVSCSNGIPFAFGTGDFTIEFWVNRSNSGCYVFGNILTSLATNYTGTINASGFFTFQTGTGTATLTGAIAIPVSTWTHVALTRASGTLRIFINGILDVSNLLFSAVNFSSIHAFAVGSPGTISGGFTGLSGKVDEFRVTNGFARYTSSFNVATAEFSNS